jgi:hypothetical protein
MDIGLHISQAAGSIAPTSSSLLSEKDQLQQSAERGTFSALLKNVAQSLSDEQRPPFSNADDSIEPATLSEADDHATGGALSGSVVASLFPVQDISVVVGPVADKAESLDGLTERHVQSTESIALLPKNLSAGAISEDRTIRTEPVPVDSPRTADSSIDSLPPPVIDLDPSGEIPAREEVSRATDGPPIRNGRSAPVALLPVPLEQLSGNSTLLTKMPPNALITEQGSSPVVENQGATSIFPAVSVNVVIQSLERPSTGMQPLAMTQEQGTDATTLLDQSLSVPVIGEGGGEEGNPFGTDAHGAGGGTFFRSGESGAPESGARGNQSQLFGGQVTSAVQAQSSSQREGSSVVTPAEDRLKMTQAFLGEDHLATVASASGKSQTVHVELPSHGSGPLSVRISMTDQMVHTQFTTDRNDLGALLFTRQDQLQQSLAKSGLELGQFQVHIDQRGQQEALPDRQPRRNGEAPEQQQASQDRNQHAQDREQPTPRPSRALSLFA